MCDSAKLRETFSDDASKIEDGWTILAEGDDGYGYGSHELLMVLRGPDGKLYEQTGNCCSCNGIDGQWGPVETNLSALRATLASHRGFYGSAGDDDPESRRYNYRPEQQRALREAIALIENGMEKQFGVKVEARP